jgi:hypothetical protein
LGRAHEIRRSKRLAPDPTEFPFQANPFTLELDKSDPDARNVIRSSGKDINQTVDLLTGLSEFGLQWADEVPERLFGSQEFGQASVQKVSIKSVSNPLHNTV